MKKIIALFLMSIIMWESQAQQEIEIQIDSILSLLTLKEKVAMCHAQSKFSSPGVPRLGIPEIWMSDGPHGVRAEISWDSWAHAGWTNDSVTAFPALTCLAASFNDSLAYEYGVAIGEEARYRKKDILLGPGVNMYRTPMNGRNFEYMGEDPYLASRLAVPYIQGVQSNGVAACVKHFALNNQERWRDHINVEVSDRALYEIYLPAFKAAVQQGKVWSIMGAYNQYQGQHCCHHERLLNDILKQDWGFDGVVVSDWGGVHDSQEAARNGLDIEMGTGTNGLTYSADNAYENYYLAGPFMEMLQKKEIDESVLNDKVRRILRLLYRTSLSTNRPWGSLNTVAHHNVARKVAQEGIVLLKNEQNLFPIQDEAGLKIAVIGENATRMMTLGGGSSELKAQFEISPLEGIQNRYKNAEISYAMGYASGPPTYGREVASTLDADSLMTQAIEAATGADIVLFIGGLNKNHFQDCEGGDRVAFGLPFGQAALIEKLAAVNNNLGVILISGNAVEMPWLSKVKGLMQAWYLGTQSGAALADVLAGDINPSGKLPFSFPKALADNAAHSFGVSSYPGDSINQEYKEGILVGYRWHETKEIPPLFAFGHGLSYTNFDITNIQTDKTNYAQEETIKVSFEVQNKGEAEGAEVVQVYVGKDKSKVMRAVKELKGYQKIALSPGTANQGQITIRVRDLAYYDEKKADWTIEPGDYYVYIGNASDRIVKKIKVNIAKASKS